MQSDEIIERIARTMVTARRLRWDALSRASQREYLFAATAAYTEIQAILVERDAEIKRLRLELEWAANQLDPLPDDY